MMLGGLLEGEKLELRLPQNGDAGCGACNPNPESFHTTPPKVIVLVGNMEVRFCRRHWLILAGAVRSELAIH